MTTPKQTGKVAHTDDDATNQARVTHAQATGTEPKLRGAVPLNPNRPLPAQTKDLAASVPQGDDTVRSATTDVNHPGIGVTSTR